MRGCSTRGRLITLDVVALLVLAISLTDCDFYSDRLEVQRRSVFQLDHIHGMAKGRQLRLCNALGGFAGVLDVQVVPNSAAFVLAINDLQGHL